MSPSDFLSIPSSQPQTLLTSASSGLSPHMSKLPMENLYNLFFLWNKPLQSFLQWEFHKSSFKLFHFQTNQVLCNHSSIIRTFSSLLTEFIFLLAPYHPTFNFSHIQQSRFIKFIDNNKEKKLSRHKCHGNLSYSRLRQEK
jgi:hypothetical protein